MTLYEALESISHQVGLADYTASTNGDPSNAYEMFVSAGDWANDDQPTGYSVSPMELSTPQGEECGHGFAITLDGAGNDATIILIPNEAYALYTGRDAEWECSKCGQFVPNTTKLCPDCGLADFDEEAE